MIYALKYLAAAKEIKITYSDGFIETREQEALELIDGSYLVSVHEGPGIKKLISYKDKDAFLSAYNGWTELVCIGIPTQMESQNMDYLAQKESTPYKNPHAVALGRLGGLKGGQKRAQNMTKEERSTKARLAANARWRKKTAPSTN